MTKELYPRTSPGPAGAVSCSTASSVNSPSLGDLVSADLQALHNDLEQAQLLAADYRWQLAGKSNECAELRQLLEKTQRDLIRLQGDVGELRKERHRLANEVMRVKALEYLEEENATLRKEIENLQGVLNAVLKAPPRISSEKPVSGQPSSLNIIELDFES